MQVILIPLDGSSHGQKALHIGCDLAEKYGGKLALLHVIAMKKGETFGPHHQALRPKGEQILKQAYNKASQRGIDILPPLIETGVPSEAILIAAKKTKASTIVMGCRGVTDSGENSFGSVSQSVFQKSNCTCISVK